MKNISLILTSLLLGACVMADGSTTATGTTAASKVKTAAATANEQMQLCMITEATNMLVDGSLLNQNVKTSAKTISNTCAQKLALQALPTEYQALAEAVINNVKASKAAQK